MPEGVAVDVNSPAPKQVLPAEVREILGKLVREAWSDFILKEFPNPPLGWIKPWDEMSAPMQEVDRVIGETVVFDFLARTSGLPVERFVSDEVDDLFIETMREVYVNGLP